MSNHQQLSALEFVDSEAEIIWFPRIVSYIISYTTFLPVYFARYKLNGLDLDARTVDMVWRGTVKKMEREWTIIIAGSTISVQLTVALLQLGPVLNHILLRTATIVAFLLSISSGLAAFIFLIFQDNIVSASKRSRWMEASMYYPMDLASINFWVCLSWPLTSLVWAMVFCVTTVVSLGWAMMGKANQSTPDATGKVEIGVVSATILLTAMIVLLQVYRVFKFVLM